MHGYAQADNSVTQNGGFGVCIGVPDFEETGDEGE